eukprot:m.141273 g.141273  ORF g.141273 m.141273 type:complete len:963 (-) comp14049_c0_seq14:5178-8066(-)
MSEAAPADEPSAAARCSHCDVTAKSMEDLTRRLRATSDLATRFLQTKAALKAANTELQEAQRVARAATQVHELSRKEIEGLKLQLQYDSSSGEVSKLKETVNALRHENEQLELRLDAAQSNVKQLRAAAATTLTQENHDKLVATVARLQTENAHLLRKAQHVEASRAVERRSLELQITSAKGAERVLQKSLASKATALTKAEETLAKAEKELVTLRSLPRMEDQASSPTNDGSSNSEREVRAEDAMPPDTPDVVDVDLPRNPEFEAAAPFPRLGPAALCDVRLPHSGCIGDVELDDGQTLSGISKLSQQSIGERAESNTEHEGTRSLIRKSSSRATLLSVFGASRLTDVVMLPPVVADMAEALPVEVTLTSPNVTETKEATNIASISSLSSAPHRRHAEVRDSRPTTPAERNRPRQTQLNTGPHLQQQSRGRGHDRGVPQPQTGLITRKRAALSLQLPPQLCTPSCLGDVVLADTTLREFDAGHQVHGRQRFGASSAMVTTEKSSKRRRLSDTVPVTELELVRSSAETIEEYILQTGDLLLCTAATRTIDGVMSAWVDVRNRGSVEEFCSALSSFFVNSTQLNAFDTGARAWGTGRSKETVSPWLVGEVNFARGLVAVSQSLPASVDHPTNWSILQLLATEVSSNRLPFANERSAGARLTRIFGVVCSRCDALDFGRSFCIDQLLPGLHFDPLQFLTFVGACPKAMRFDDTVDLAVSSVEIPTSSAVATIAVQVNVLAKLSMVGRHTLAPEAALSRLHQLCGWPKFSPVPQTDDVDRMRVDLVSATVGAMSIPRKNDAQSRFRMPEFIRAEDAYWVLHMVIATNGPFDAFQSPLKDTLLPLLYQTAAPTEGDDKTPQANMELLIATLWAIGFVFREALRAKATDTPDSITLKQSRTCLVQTLKSDLPMAARRAAALGLASGVAIRSDHKAISALHTWVASLTSSERTALPALLSQDFGNEES